MARLALLWLTLWYAAATVACQSGEPENRSTETAARTDSVDRQHEHEEDEEERPLSTRADEAARDAGEKPEQVLDELGVDEGSKVADVIAGGGYYTYLLAERVGPSGRVYADGQQVPRRLAEGDLAGRSNIEVVQDLSAVPAGTLDAIIVNRGYHLLDKESFLPAALAALKPGGTLGIIEVRLGSPRGHDMRTHRMGEETVREEVTGGGFEFAGASNILANESDPRTDFMEGQRHTADRMFLKFRKPEEGSSS